MNFTRTVLFASAFAAVCTSANAAEKGDGRTGTWTIQRDDDSLFIRLESRPGSSHGFTVPASSIRKTAAGLVLERQAGRFDLVGPFDGNRGGGTFTFAASASYKKALEELGLGPISARRQLELATVDLTLDFVADLRKLGYNVELKRLMEMRIHRAGPEYVRALKRAGYENISAKRLVEMRIHGVTPDYIGGMVEAGFGQLSPKRLVEMRIHGVTPDFVSQTKRAGLNPTAKQLVEMRIHGVTPSYIDSLKKRGLDSLSVRRLVEFRIHGVDAKFVSGMKELGYRNIPARKLVEMRIHGVSPTWVKGVISRRDTKPTVRRLIEMRIHGID